MLCAREYLKDREFIIELHMGYTWSNVRLFRRSNKFRHLAGYDFVNKWNLYTDSPYTEFSYLMKNLEYAR